MNKKRILNYGLISLGIVVLVIFLSTLDREAVRGAISLLSLPMMFIIVGFTIVNLSIKSLRWQFLMYSVDKERIPFWLSFRSILAGVAGGSFVPGRIEMAKPFLLKVEKNISLSKTISAVFIERIFDFMMILGILLISLIFLPQQELIDRWVVITFLIILILGTTIISFFPTFFSSFGTTLLSRFLNPTWNKKAQAFLDQFFCNFSLFTERRQVFLLLLFSFAAHLLEILRLQFILYTLGIHSSFTVVCLTFTIAVIISIISMIPGGLGVAELTSWGVLLALLPTQGQEVIKSAVLIDRIFAYYLLIIAGSIILLKVRERKNTKHLKTF